MALSSAKAWKEGEEQGEASVKSSLFIAIEMEELPASFIDVAQQGIEDGIKKLCSSVEHGSVQSWASPRHIAVSVSDLPSPYPKQRRSRHRSSRESSVSRWRADQSSHRLCQRKGSRCFRYTNRRKQTRSSDCHPCTKWWREHNRQSSGQDLNLYCPKFHSKRR